MVWKQLRNLEVLQLMEQKQIPYKHKGKGGEIINKKPLSDQSKNYTEKYPEHCKFSTV